MTPFIAEIIGTMLMILLGNGVGKRSSERNKGNNSGWIVITTGWAFAVSFMWCSRAGPVSGAHLNPIVTLWLNSVGKFAWNQVATYALPNWSHVRCFLSGYFTKIILPLLKMKAEN
jgi:glycerol uptake facilitator protein